MQERKQKTRLNRRKYYENNRYKFSKHCIENMQKEIDRLNKEIPEKIHEYYKIYAYGVNMENYTISILRHYGIAKEKSFYQECVSNTYLGYMYSIGRCAYCGYTGKHVENYIKLMIRVGIICGINTSNEARQIAKEIHAKVIYLEDD